MTEPPTRAIGRTGLRVSALGFGGAPITNLGRVVVDATALATIKAAYASGVRYFDTAPFYGYGLGKHRIGHVLRNRPRAVCAVDEGGLPSHAKRRCARMDDAFPGALPFDCVWDYSHDADALLRGQPGSGSARTAWICC